MVYRFTLISDETDHFVREIQIDSEATFLDFHKAIIESVGYPDDQMTSFFICNENWEKETEITLEDMESSSDEDNWVMKDTVISELLEDELDFDVDGFNRKVITEPFNRAVLEEIARDLDPENPKEHGKTLIYAVDDAHADIIVRILKEIYSEYGVDNDAVDAGRQLGTLRRSED